tara:strand:- start:114749 stop:116149 length:1401 start_codon:yes stop_codon:yes gene_type:complete
MVEFYQLLLIGIILVSLFECFDRADEALKYLTKKNNFINKSYLFFSGHTEHSFNTKKQAEITLFKKIRHRLSEEQALIEEDGYSHLVTLLDDLLPEMQDYLKTNSPQFTSDLTFILKELALISLQEKCKLSDAQLERREQREIAQRYGIDKVFYITNSMYKYELYKIACVNQLNAFGTSGGMCYGLTSIMAIPRMSPYQNERIKHIRITRKVYTNHNNQHHEKDDQKFIKKTLLSRLHFCTNKKQQARQILEHAKKYPSKDLELDLTSLKYAHACYLRINIQDNKKQEICYMDPNHGAYRFDTDAQFIEFYALSLKESGYTRYQLVEMQYDPAHLLLRNRSFEEILYSLLSNRRYQNYDGMTGKLFFGVILALNALLVLLLTTATFVLSLYLFTHEVAVACALLTYAVCLVAAAHHYQGFLGPVQFFEECCHQLNLFIHSWIGGPEKELEEASLAEPPVDSGFSMA